MGNYKIAVASSDGIVVNQHFGHAGKFYIYDVTDNEFHRTDDIRYMQPVCEMRNHDDERLKENMSKLQDCKYLLVSRIGAGAAATAEQYGITPMELPLMIDDAVGKAVSFERVQNLFERK